MFYSNSSLDEDTGSSALVDPAAPKLGIYIYWFIIDRTVLSWLKKSINLEQIWTTHHHQDHSSGNIELLASFPFLKVYGSDDRIPAVNVKVKERETWKLGSCTVQALYTPGHTTGCISYYVVDQKRNQTRYKEQSEYGN